MAISRLMPLDGRSGLLIALGAAVLLAPPALDLSPAAIVAGLFIGVIAIGLGIAGTATSDHAAERQDETLSKAGRCPP